MEEHFITLLLDDGEELDCRILTIFEAAGRDYVALLPVDAGEDDDNVFLYRYYEDENEVPSIEYIDDDEEYEIVDEAFDEWLDSQEYDELVSADEDME